jgi:hypothetical protein
VIKLKRNKQTDRKTPVMPDDELEEDRKVQHLAKPPTSYYFDYSDRQLLRRAMWHVVDSAIDEASDQETSCMYKHHVAFIQAALKAIAERGGGCGDTPYLEEFRLTTLNAIDELLVRSGLQDFNPYDTGTLDQPLET